MSPQKEELVKKVKKALLGRVMIVTLAVLFQFVWLVLLVYQFSQIFPYFNLILQILAVVIALHIVGGWRNPSYKIVWTFVILAFPVVGLSIYAVFGRCWIASRTRAKMERSHGELIQHLPKDEDLEDEIAQEDQSVANQSRYITKWSDFPLYTNTATKYYTCGEDMFQSMLEDMERAEHFIFLEFFIVAHGELFDQILDVLYRKVQRGVDVRLVYDDFGCITTLSNKFYLELEKLGIRCRKFNPMRPVMSLLMNNRDHRKILIVDGHTGYTGGMNLADEYINVKEKYGYWKDSGVRMEGEAVWSLTTMFLEMWNYLTDDKECYTDYKPGVFQTHPFVTDGYVQPYGDSPLVSEKVGAYVYMNMLGHAKDYVYIFTPYLILDNEMLTNLRNAAKSGVDVRIVIPEIPDKKLIFWMSQSYYRRLLESGVRIYQYTPGFMHAKSFVCDDKIAAVGSINMDFRSLYLHFECAVWLYNCESVMEVKEDCLRTFEESREICMEFVEKQSWIKRLLLSWLRLFAPLV